MTLYSRWKWVCPCRTIYRLVISIISLPQKCRHELRQSFEALGYKSWRILRTHFQARQWRHRVSDVLCDVLLLRIWLVKYCTFPWEKQQQQQQNHDHSWNVFMRRYWNVCELWTLNLQLYLSQVAQALWQFIRWKLNFLENVPEQTKYVLYSAF